MLSYLVAISNNNVIGKNNTLPWHCPEDLKHFKKITMGNTIIMGRKTFESLPNILPNRKHIVLSRNTSYSYNDANVEILHDIDDIISLSNSTKEFFVIGGSDIFSVLLPYVKKLYLTRIHKYFHGDTFFPAIDLSEWILTEKEQHLDLDLPLTFITYVKKEKL